MNVWLLPICGGKERLKKENGEKLHSTQKPIELLKRIILTSTKEGDLILDPMAGTGTTGYVAKALKRNFVMIENNQEYVEGIRERFKHPLSMDDLLYTLSEKLFVNFVYAAIPDFNIFL
ncbi:MAG: DNA-methyltransferase [Aquificaceae bacterium]